MFTQFLDCFVFFNFNLLFQNYKSSRKRQNNVIFTVEFQIFRMIAAIGAEGCFLIPFSLSMEIVGVKAT
jgi:hypothetical protein